MRGLIKNGAQVIECNSRLLGVSKYFDLVRKFWKIKNRFDVMVVGFPGFQSLILARFLTRKPIIFDAFVSLYDSMVWDRKLVKPKSLKALYYWLLDWLACRLADKVLLDTLEHIIYFVGTFKIRAEKFNRIFVGADEEIFYPRPINKKNQEFVVHFHGTYLPLQGVDYIVEAANILRGKGIIFNLIGEGQEFKKIQKRVLTFGLEKTVRLIKAVPIEELASYMSQADICLGIFGDVDKTRRVIPNKVYEAIAMAKPVISADTPAAREAFKEGDIMFCRLADGKDLAEKILILKNNKELQGVLSENGYNLFRQKFHSSVLGFDLLSLIIKLSNTHEEKY